MLSIVEIIYEELGLGSHTLHQISRSILHVQHFKWIISTPHRKKSNTKRENICWYAPIARSLKNFWSLIAITSYVAIDKLIALSELAKAQVSNFDLPILINENIFHFYVSIDVALLMNICQSV